MSFIPNLLAIMNLTVPTDDHQNCGLMQGDYGSKSYNPGNSIADSQASITGMVRDGTEKTSQGVGYVLYLNGDSSISYTGCPAGNP